MNLHRFWAANPECAAAIVWAGEVASEFEAGGGIELLDEICVGLDLKRPSPKQIFAALIALGLRAKEASDAPQGQQTALHSLWGANYKAGLRRVPPRGGNGSSGTGMPDWYGD